MVNSTQLKDSPSLLQFLPAILKPIFSMNLPYNFSLITRWTALSPYSKSIWIKYFLFLFFFSFSNSLAAQQEPQYTNYMFNTLAYNPAYAGSKEYLSVRALYRDQWYNFGGGLPNASSDGRPITQTFSIHGNILKKIGLGVNIINDRIGVRGSTSLDISYAYRIDFGTGIVSLGLQAGIMNWRANWDELAFKDPKETDNAFDNQNPSLWLPNFGAGIYYYNDKFYMGVSVPRLASISTRRDSARTEVRRWAKIYQHFYITAGGLVTINEKIDFKPSLLIKSVGLFSDFLQKGDEIRNVGAPTSFDLSASLLFYDKLWIGTSFRSAFAAFLPQNGTKSSLASIDAFMGYQFPEGMRIGFAYDYPLNAINTYSVGSFEIMLGWDFIRKIDKVAHPRYFF